MPALRINVGFVVKPAIKGFWDSSRMDSRSAPSAKILTLNAVDLAGAMPRARFCSEFASGMAAPLPAGDFDNPIRGFGQRSHFEIRSIGAAFAIAVINEHGLAAGALAGFHVAPAVADDVTRGQVDIPTACGIEEQSGLRFAAGAMIAVVMRANE